MALLAGGSSAQLIRDTGSPNAVQGFYATGSLGNANLLTPLPFNALFQAGDGFATFSLIAFINSIRIGSITPSKMYLGTTEVSKIYIGTNLVYQS